MNKFRIDVFSYLLVATAAGCLIWFKGDLFGLDTNARKAIAIIALCAFLLAITLYLGFEPRRDEADAVRSLLKGLNRNLVRLAGTTQALLIGQDAKTNTAETPLARLRDHLRHEHGFRWRYRLPWMLLTGDDSSISRLLPELAEHGWLITQEAVLLWSKTGKDGRPDEFWLKQLYKLRRRRPVDVIVLTVTDSTDLLPPRLTTSAYGRNLRYIADALYWAAPVFVLDVGQTDEVGNGNTQVIGCEFPPDADTGAIEAALLSLRDQLAHRSVKPLVANFRDCYGPELSERLDTRAAPLAAWIAGLSERERRGHAWEHQDALPKEVLSLSVAGTNGMLPRKALREASITRMRDGFAHIEAVRNLTTPTLPVYPPTGDRFHWRILSHLAPNYLSLLNAEILRGSLALYDWTEGELNKRRIEAITDLSHRLLKKLVKGGLQRGVEIEVTLDSSQFAGDGDLELFGGMLSRFFGLYAKLNLYTKLVIVSQPTGRRIEWPETKGEGAPF